MGKEKDNGGWIKLYRSIQDNPLWKEPRIFSRAEAWIDILMEVRWLDEPKEVVIKNTVLMCYRGESLYSLETWAGRWGWTKSATRRFLNLLKKLGQIDTQSETHTTRLKVCNYDTYQVKGTQSETEMNSKRNADETEMAPKEESKEGKKVKKIYSEDSVPVVLASELRDRANAKGRLVKQPDVQKWARHIDLMIRVDKVSPGDIRRAIEFVDSDPERGDWPGWGAVILSTKKLREKYPTIAAKFKAQKSLGDCTTCKRVHGVKSPAEFKATDGHGQEYTWCRRCQPKRYERHNPEKASDGQTLVGASGTRGTGAPRPLAREGP